MSTWENTSKRSDGTRPERGRNRGKGMMRVRSKTTTPDHGVRRPSLRPGPSALAFVLSLLLAGCSGGSPTMSHSTPKGSDRPDMRQAMKISDDDLAKRRLRELWSYNVGNRIEQLWFLGGNLYLTTEGSRGKYKLIKVSGESGLVEWTFDLTGRLEFRPSVYEYSDDLKAVGRTRELFLVQNDLIHALDDEVGLEVYKIKTRVSVSTPCAVADDNLFVGTWDHRVYAFGKQSQIEQWTYLTDGPIVSTPTVGRLNVYSGSEDGGIYCHNTGAGYQDGDSWVHKTGGKIVMSPCFFKGRVYVGSWDYKVYCLEEFRGLPRWIYPAGAPVVGAIFPYSDFVYATTRDDRDPDSVSTNVIALGEDDGAFKWERKGIHRVLAANALHCFALSDDGQIHSLRNHDGESDWMLDVSRFQFILGQDAELGAKTDLLGRMVVATADGFIQCIQPRK